MIFRSLRMLCLIITSYTYNTIIIILYEYQYSVWKLSEVVVKNGKRILAIKIQFFSEKS